MLIADEKPKRNQLSWGRRQGWRTQDVRFYRLETFALLVCFSHYSRKKNGRKHQRLSGPGAGEPRDPGGNVHFL